MARSTETASLILKADATQITKGSEALDKLTVSADKAERATDKLGGASKASSKSLKDMAQAASEKVQAQNASITASRVELTSTNAVTEATKAAVRSAKDLALGRKSAAEAASTLAARSGALAAGAGLVGVAVGLVAVGIGAMVTAAIKGYNESERLRVALIATGNAAGVSAGQLDAMAEGVGAATGEYGDARKAIELFAASGKVAGAGMAGLAQQAVNMSKVTGDSIDKSVAKIIELGEKPSDTIAKLNEQYHVLTSAQYAQIAALEAEGKVREAGIIANQLEAKAMKDRTKDVEDNAGIMIRAAHSVAVAWNGAWDAMKGVGRTEGDWEKAADLIRRADAMTTRSFANGKWTTVSEPQLARDLRAQAAQLQAKAIADSFAKQAAGAKDAAEQDAIAAQRATAQYDSPDLKRSNAIKLASKHMADQLGAAGLTDEDKTRIRTRYANEVTAANLAFESAMNKGAGKSRKGGGKSDPFASLNGLVQGAQVFDAGIGGNKQQNDQVTKILAIVDAGAKLIAKGEDVATVQAKVATGVAALNDGYAKQADIIKAQNVVAIAQYQASLDKQNDALQRTITSQIDKIGMGDKEYQQQQQINDLYVKGAEALTQLQLKRDGVAAKGGDTSVLDANIAALQVNTDKQVKIVTAGYKQMDAARADWTNGLKSSLANYLDQAGDVAGQSATLFTNAFNGMSDSLANFATTGKLNFKGLVASILTDLAKMEMRIAMSKILQQVLGYFMGPSTGQQYTAAGGNGAGDGGYGMMLGNYAKGGVFNSPSLSAYSGHVVSRATPFKFAAGAGIMGEAGPEAIMPLSRGSDGKLGVKAMGAQGDIIINTNVTVDGNGNAKSDTTGDTSADSARQLGKMIETKVREVMTSESRQGGQLWRMRQP